MANDESQPRVKDVWENGDAYGVFMGRWSRLIAVKFLEWLSVPAGSKWLDVGCGTGILSQTILDVTDPVIVRGIDQASGFVSFAENHIRDPRASFEVGSAEFLPSESNIYDAAVSGLVLNFIPKGDQAVSELKRVIKPGCVVAAYVWDYADKMQLLRHFWDAAVLLDSEAAMLDEGKRFPLCNPEKLRELFAAQGLKSVEVKAIEVQTHFTDFEDYWSPFLSGQGPAPSYLASLNKGQQSDLREQVRAHLPISAHGTIDLVARAWAVRGYS